MDKMRMSDSDGIISLYDISMAFRQKWWQFHFQAKPTVVDFIFWSCLWGPFYNVTNSIHQGSTLMTKSAPKGPIS